MPEVVLSESGEWKKTAKLVNGQVAVRDEGPPIDIGPGRVGLEPPRRCTAVLYTEAEARALQAALNEWFPPAVASAKPEEAPRATLPPLVGSPDAVTVLLPETFVPGIAYPKGSKVITRLPAKCPNCKKGISLKSGVCRIGPLVESADMQTKTRPSRSLQHWCADVADATRARAEILAEADANDAVELELIFYLPRPESVKPSKRPYPTVKPDGDKLQRAVQDALIGIAYEDDSQVTDSIVRRRYADSREPGVVIRARMLGAAQVELALAGDVDLHRERSDSLFAAKARYKVLRAAGLCVQCKAPARTGFTRCEGCRERNAAAAKRVRD